MGELAENQPADLLIVLGKNIGVGSSPEDIRRNRSHQLSPDARMNVLAAGQVWWPGMEILLSTGQTAGPDVPAEAELMKNYLLRHYPDIPEDAVITEDQSIDTASNAAEVAKIIGDRTYRDIGLLSVGYHLPRAARLFADQGVKVDHLHASEDLLTQRSVRHARYTERWRRSPRVKAEQFKELALRGLLRVDPEAKWTQKIARRSRK